MRVEANGDGDGDEADGDGEMQEIQNLRRARAEFSAVHLAAQEDVDRGQGQREPCHVGLIDFLDHYVRLKEVDAGIDERKNRGNGGEDRHLPFGLQRDQRGNREDGKEQRGEVERQAKLAAVIELRVPSDVKQECAGIAHDQQAAPGLEGDQKQRGEVENRDVGRKARSRGSARSRAAAEC